MKSERESNGMAMVSSVFGDWSRFFCHTVETESLLFLLFILRAKTGQLRREKGMCLWCSNSPQ